MELETVEVNGIELSVATAGSRDAPPLVLLHGWPESGRGWDPVVPLLGDDFALIVPDQRGFGRSARPEGTNAYQMTTLVSDIVGLIDWWGAEQAGVVGHDFGGAVAWALGALAPQRVTRMVVLSSPHPMRLREVGQANVDQIARAFYVWLMHAGEAGERLLAANDFRLLSDWAFGRSQGVSEVKRAAYREEWRQPGAFHAMAEWYRASYTPDVFNPDVSVTLPPVRVPVRYVHGERDMAFAAGMETGSSHFVDADYDEHVIAGTSHWLVHERPDEVARLVREWMAF